MATVNNAFYDELGERWYEDDGHPIALLRAESGLKLRYVLDALAASGIRPPARILDVACGAGFLAIPLAEAGYRVHGIDLARSALAVAARRGGGKPNLSFAREDALALACPDESYDAVLLMDFLEHVDRPAAAVREAARALKPGGLLVFHTFNRTFVAWALAVKAMALLARDAPEHIHVQDLFIKPAELRAMAAAAGVDVVAVSGLRPRLDRAFFWSLAHRRVHPAFAFTGTSSLAAGYLGHGRKRP